MSSMADETSVLDPVTGTAYRGCDVGRHLDPDGMPRCAAYPGGIPLPILAGDVAHDRPLPGDRGIRFERATPAELRRRMARSVVDLKPVAGIKRQATRRAG